MAEQNLSDRAGAPKFDALIDTPDTKVASNLVEVNPGADALIYSDKADLPISTATQTALGTKGDESAGSGTMDGDFTSGSWKAERVGGMIVFRWGTGTHPSSNSASTSTPIPAEFRPTQNINNVYLITGTSVRTGRMTGAGILTTSYRDWTGASTNLTQADGGSMAWPIT